MLVEEVRREQEKFYNPERKVPTLKLRGSCEKSRVGTSINSLLFQTRLPVWVIQRITAVNTAFINPASKSPLPFFLSFRTYWRKKKCNFLRIKNFEIKSGGFSDSEIADVVINRTADNAGKQLRRTRSRSL